MNNLAYKKSELNNILTKLDLQQIERFFLFIKNTDLKEKKFRRKSHAGIWKNLNIDIQAFELELSNLRNETTKDLDNKIL
jgi:hypothetical protein